MTQMDRKPYASPSVQELGALKDITESGGLPLADTPGGSDGTANKPGS
ncbi:hypothetical protein [Franzmannia qiaohouensis]|uniref:Lasso RiPP family leader peptide-containing protein n=1 Tax=Franzmannia qiaohouensis TaxID=1329370 RepID=A0ABU1HJA7_9GAMM|nr:hypothetical protein [Halomonas qiaohouensis]MDR5906854.1 hypothetical protein [Halomonas qiaohouensis]